MSAYSTVTIVCDHLGCEAAVESGDAGRARRIARRHGWLVADSAKRRRTRDFCPEHRSNRTFYG